LARTHNNATGKESFTFALSVICKEKIEETFLNIDRQGSVANSRYAILPSCLDFLKALL
jgi:hypothetical protein